MHEPCLQEGRCCYIPNVHIQGRHPERKNLQQIEAHGYGNQCYRDWQAAAYLAICPTKQG